MMNKKTNVEHRMVNEKKGKQCKMNIEDYLTKKVMYWLFSIN